MANNIHLLLDLTFHVSTSLAVIVSYIFVWILPSESPCKKNYSTLFEVKILSAVLYYVLRRGGSKCVRSLGVLRWTSDHGVRYESAPTLARNAILIRTEQGPEQCIKVMDLAFSPSHSHV